MSGFEMPVSTAVWANSEESAKLFVCCGSERPERVISSLKGIPELRCDDDLGGHDLGGEA